MIPQLNADQINTLASMNEYWEEVSKRPYNDAIRSIWVNELNQAVGTIGLKDVLLIIGDHAKKLKEGLKK